MTAIATLVGIMRRDEASPAARVAAANAVLDRGFGKPERAVYREQEAEIGAEMRPQTADPPDRSREPIAEQHAANTSGAAVCGDEGAANPDN